MVRANLHLTDYEAPGRPGADDLGRHCTAFSTVLTQELEGAAEATGLTSEEILLAAFGRAIRRTIGMGSLTALSAQRMADPIVNSGTHPTSDVLFAYGIPMARPARLGHFLEIHAHVAGDMLRIDWWYDTRSFEPYTVHELAEQLPHAVIEMTSEAAPPILATAELAAAY